MTLVSSPAPPAVGSTSVPPPPPSGVFELDRDVLLGAAEDELVLELSRRKEPSEPPLSESRPRVNGGDASIAAASLGAGFDARAVLIHVRDPETAELRVIGAWGEGASVLLGAVGSSDDDFVASTVVANGRLTMDLTGGLPRVAPLRIEVLGAARSLIAVSIVASGRCVGLIEVVDVDESLTDRLAKACAAVAESLACSL
jgi:hypothetical protein